MAESVPGFHIEKGTSKTYKSDNLLYFKTHVKLVLPANKRCTTFFKKHLHNSKRNLFLDFILKKINPLLLCTSYAECRNKAARRRS